MRKRMKVSDGTTYKGYKAMPLKLNNEVLSIRIVIRDQIESGPEVTYEGQKVRGLQKVRTGRLRNCRRSRVSRR